jgi:hypothetical protein
MLGAPSLLHPVLGHTQAYITGFQAGIGNKTFDSACPYTMSNDNYSKCSDGFNAGYTAPEKPMTEYQFGFNAGKNDSILFLYDSDDQCKVFLSRSNICSADYSDAYRQYANGPQQPNANSLITAYHETSAYRTGYEVGRTNGNAETACTKYDYRHYLVCNNAWYDGRTPGLDGPPCSNVIPENATNSCYSVGEKDGADLASKYINRCHELSYIPDPPGKHSKNYIQGWLTHSKKFLIYFTSGISASMNLLLQSLHMSSSSRSTSTRGSDRVVKTSDISSDDESMSFRRLN